MGEQPLLCYRSLRRRQIVPARLERVFPFFESPDNLALITPPSLKFRLVSRSPVSMQKGSVIDYTLRLAGVPLAWRSLISRYEPPHCFVDEQLKGPYASWCHTHRFAPCSDGTLIEDEVVYALPVSMPPVLECAVHSLYVRPSLENIFDYRSRFYADFFAGGVGESRPQNATLQAATEVQS